ncbi:senecionine N-oxygenase-like [Phymastichus coffea]|uniref:senecionine N-oxygenase-like n=1 Tax=Phymastichus coffea TaxID=108790 RepID=UPI00273C7671|nr:senecionine N-oxygenase-like [Phymastichus coffea]
MSGLVSAKHLSENNMEPIVFEKVNDIGGQWRYTDKTDVDEHGLPIHSSIYKNLRTNGPKILMTFPDYREFHGENRSYIKHETVLEYLTNFTDHFNLRQYIKFNTLVERISQLPDEKWRIETRNLNLNKIEVHTCDAVMVCDGHFTKPNVPSIPGIDTFPGRTLHSHTYRRPEEFAGKTVVVLGASFSGIDIGVEVSKYAKTVYLSHRHKKLTVELPKNMIQVPGVVAASGSDLILSDSSRIKADVFLMCTGYLYDYPFLDDNSGITVTKGKYIHPLYKQLVNVNHPTMVFIGLPHPGFPFVVPYVQVRYFVSLLRGKAKLPSRDVMLKESELPPGTPVSRAHFMQREVLDYYDNLAKLAGIQPISKKLRHLIDIYLNDLNNNPMYFRENELFMRDGEVIYIQAKRS